MDFTADPFGVCTVVHTVHSDVIAMCLDSYIQTCLVGALLYCTIDTCDDEG
jgi:hypothetical protein